MITTIITILIIILIIIIIISFVSCQRSYKTKNGNTYVAGSQQTAEVVDILREIAYDVPNNIKQDLSNKLSDKLRNTTFKEINGGDPKIVGWNYNKGREIGVRIINKYKVPYSSDVIVDTLLHELAHSITDKYGHGDDWKEINNYLQQLKPNYVSFLINKTFLTQ